MVKVVYLGERFRKIIQSYSGGVSMNSIKYKIGIVGTGFVARGLMYSLKYHPELELAGVLTRRDPKTLEDVPADKRIITRDIAKLIKSCDLIVECSGDAVHGTE